MKLKQLITLVALLAATTIYADPILVPVRPLPTGPSNGGNPRSPIVTPVFYLDGHTLTASSYTLGSTVQLLDENDDVVFSTYISIEGDIQLPASLSGTFTMLVTRGDQAFEGEINL